MSELKSLEQHDQERRQWWMDRDMRNRNGLECPKCKRELVDSNPNVVLTSNPPKKHVHCPHCTFQGTVLS
jgi:DNA-directed RNA polymerase subunit RPC12/RpoP